MNHSGSFKLAGVISFQNYQSRASQSVFKNTGEMRKGWPVGPVDMGYSGFLTGQGLLRY